ncbi:MAG: DNA-directed DNA polymerase II small subunit [Nanoarchaeota archaeon]|nr:DNA-directed DNA polymerase II small subunit [Nanoarchaeota archaeon]
MSDTSQMVSAFMEKNIFLSPEYAERIASEKGESLFGMVSGIMRRDSPLLLNSEDAFKEIFPQEAPLTSVSILSSYDKEAKKKEVRHFVAYLKARYGLLKNILMNRLELQGSISIKRATEKKSMERISLIGMVLEKNITKNNNICFLLEDTTGTMKVIVKNNNRDAFEAAKEILEDEVIGLVGGCNGDVLFANQIILPDMPIMEYKKCPDDVSAAFISDMHIGSTLFLRNEFSSFIEWINGEVGSDEQKTEALKIKYLFIAGDAVDGIGIYPGQEEELDIKDIEQQYAECARYLSRIRKDISIMICGGNHDALRISEPQPGLDRNYAKSIYEIPNVTVVSNPSLINIHAVKGFPGLNVLMYHGFSFDYYVANVENIRLNGGYDRADLVMKLLLQKRHLGPAHKSTLHVPDEETDPLVIGVLPDIFVTGHIHRTAVSSYKSTTLISSSCWQTKTAFQEKTGHNPQPARVPVVNLKTREIKVIKFTDK